MTDLVEQTRKYLNEEPDDEEQEFLTGIISSRSGVIVAGLMKTKQYANEIDGQVRNLKGGASKLKTSKTPETPTRPLPMR